MKTVGLLGGMTCESSLEYYRLINQGVRERLGGVHSARSVMVSIDFADIDVWMRQNKWEPIIEIVQRAARDTERGGADFLVICTNTIHKLAEHIEAVVDIPILHIADMVAEAIKARGHKSTGLLGTSFTMEEEFYRSRLQEKHGLEVLIPDGDDRKIVNHVIYEELSTGILKEDSRREYQRIIRKLNADGAEGVILGCTEIGLLVKPEDSPVPLFDSTVVHAGAAVEYALAD
jgi:aspartate racemase